MDIDKANCLNETAFDSFSIRIKFERNSPNPERIFVAMAGFIQAMQEIDATLARCVSATVRPEYILEDVETASLKACLRSILHNLDDDDLRNLNWKRLAGAFVVKAKYWLLKHLSEEPVVTSSSQLSDIADGIDAIAQDSGALEMNGYQPISHHELLSAITALSASRKVLSEGDSAEYQSLEGSAVIVRVEVLTREDYDNQLLDLIHEGEYEAVLKIRKPDFIGNSKWGFLRNGKNVGINVADNDWLQKFRVGDVTLRPGDLMRVRIKEGVRKNRKTGAVDTIEIIKTIREVYREHQINLPLPLR